VFILRALSGTEKALGIRRREVGVRIPANPVSPALIRALGNPLYSITAKRSMAGGDDAASADTPEGELAIAEEELFTGGAEIDDIRDVSMVLDPGEEQPRIFSTILDLSGTGAAQSGAELIRRGAGQWPL
jgi:tRNA A37 threonylcarbamoyladenosine synthetase subunit TsaC/SUA5/YrdC